jgi:hypothetical protein
MLHDIQMILKSLKKNPSDKIREILSGIKSSDLNRIEGIYLDEVLNIFFKIEGEITVPGISVKELDYKTGLTIFENIAKVAPEIFYSHSFMEKRKPAAEEHSLQFCRKIEGAVIDFVHVIRIDFRFTPGSGVIVTSGNNDIYPSYNSERLFFKSRLVPVEKGSLPENIDSIKIKDSESIEADQRRFASVIFEEKNTRSMSVELSKRAGPGIFPLSVNIYPFIAYDYFTACLSLPDPLPHRIEEGALLFEPLFFYIDSLYRGISENGVRAEKEIPGSLIAGGDTLHLTEDYIKKLNTFFSRYSIYTDDTLMLQGLRKISTV